MDDKPISPLPEKFEDFAKQMNEPKRRRNAPAKKPVDMPEPKKTTRSEKIIGGMEETKWSGIPMWKCPRCRGTTFDASEAKAHVCKKVKFADDEPDE